MSLILAMIPLYLFGNLHCIGMCGPLVSLLAKHPFRFYYFLGRIFSFTLLGFLSGFLGFVLQCTLKNWHLSCLFSLVFGFLLFIFGCLSFFTSFAFFPSFFSSFFQIVEKKISFLFLQNKRKTSFLFGFFTPLLPCGQTVILFSSSALSMSFFWGALNAFFFAVCTSPSLFFAMTFSRFVFLKKNSKNLSSLMAMLIGVLGILRGLAELELISHAKVSTFDLVFF